LRPDIPVLVLDRRKRFEFGAMRRLAAYCHTAKVDILHVHGRSSFSFVAVARLLGFVGRGVPIILHDHYGKIEIDFSVPRWFRRVGRHVLNAYVGVSPRLGTWARTAGVPPAKIHVIENALDLERLRPSSRWDVRAEMDLSTAPIGILVCGIRPEKGVDLLIEAVAAQTLPMQCLIVGADTDPVYAASCRALVAQHGIADRVRFLGVRMDVPALLSGCDFALMPSRSESGPLVLIEIMAAALPFVAFEVGSISQQAARSGVPGFVTPLDVVAFARAVDTLLMLSPAARRARGAAGEQIAQAHFKIEAKLPEWLAIYRKMLSNPTEQ